MRKQISEKKNRKEKAKNLPLVQGEAHLLLAGPAHPGRSVVFLPRAQAARWRGADAVDGTSTSRGFQASPCLLLPPGDALEHAPSIPPSRASSPSPSPDFSTSRRLPGAPRHGT